MPRMNPAVKRGLARRKPRPVTLARAADRRATDIPLNARVAVAVIDNPYGIAEGPVRSKHVTDGGKGREVDGDWVSQGQPKIEVVRSMRADLLGAMHSRHQIDDVQFAAGRQWQDLYERAGIGAIQSVDTAKEPVDGGGVRDVLSDGQMRAMRELRRVELAIGRDGHRLVEQVLGRGKPISLVAAEHGEVGKGARDRCGRLFRMYLNDIAVEFGLATENAIFKKSA